MRLKNRFKLHMDDGYDIMKHTPAQSIDVIITDPPYLLSEHYTGEIVLTGRENVNKYKMSNFDMEFEPERLVDDFERIIKPAGNIFIFTSDNLIGRYFDLFNPIFDTVRLFTWHKTNPAMQIRKKSFLHSTEHIICCWKKGHKFNFLGQRRMHNHFECPTASGRERCIHPRHPFQKPERLLKYFIEISSDEDDIIFDPFAGVASTGAAALKLGRRFAGVEIEYDYYIQGVRRLSKLEPFSI